MKKRRKYKTQGRSGSQGSLPRTNKRTYTTRGKEIGRHRRAPPEGDPEQQSEELTAYK
jgi:hypothetical protein